MKKITILALHLGYGGIENAITTLANSLSEKYDVEILSVYRLYNEPVFKLNSNVKVNYISSIKPNKKEMIYYFKKKNYSMFFKGIKQSLNTFYVKYIKTSLELKKLDTDVLITTRILHNYMSGFCASKNIRKIAWEHNHHNNKRQYIKSLIRSCKRVDYLVTVSNGLKEFYKKYLGNKVVSIPNILDSDNKKLSKLDATNFISVGRLSKEKGFDDMLKLFKRISNKYPTWKLNIIGDGLENKNLLKLSKELKLTDKVIFHGFKDKEYINNMLLDSSIYLMTSHTESFGIVLIDAMNYGVPCIAYKSAQGANEIIVDNETGFLIDDRCEDKMIEKIELLITDDKLRKKMGKNAKEKSKDYSGEKILIKWEKIINKRK